MLGIGFSELIVIAIILIIAVGPNRMPGMLKAVVKGYREFRRATRELRASTGIDDILQDEALQDLRQPLRMPPPGAKKPAVRPPALTRTERAQENPPEGVDIAEIRARENAPSPEEAERIRAAKIASMPPDEEIIARKMAAAKAEDDIRAAKIAAARRPDDAYEAERIRAAKLAAVDDEAEGDEA